MPWLHRRGVTIKKNNRIARAIIEYSKALLGTNRFHRAEGMEKLNHTVSAASQSFHTGS
jgi:hypothetical protein